MEIENQKNFSGINFAVENIFYGCIGDTPADFAKFISKLGN